MLLHVVTHKFIDAKYNHQISIEEKSFSDYQMNWSNVKRALLCLSLCYSSKERLKMFAV